MDAQLKKGFIEACVLSVLKKGDSYGYRMIRDISPYMELSESTLYPVLRRMEKGSLLRSYTAAYEGRLRRYFSITDEGRESLLTFQQELSQLTKILDFIKGEDINEQS